MAFISGFESILSEMCPVLCLCVPAGSDLLHAAVCLLLCCVSVSVCLSVRLLGGWVEGGEDVGAVYSCQSRAEEAEEEATCSSFSLDLLALCNRSEPLPLPLPGSRASMLTTHSTEKLKVQLSPKITVQ